MIVGTGSIYFLVVALKLISAEFEWPRTIPSIAYSLQYFGGGVGGIDGGEVGRGVGATAPFAVTYVITPFQVPCPFPPKPATL